jgi:hypothetical protein
MSKLYATIAEVPRTNVEYAIGGRLVHYFDAHNAHIVRSIMQKFRPLPFERFMALAKHLNAIH